MSSVQSNLIELNNINLELKRLRKETSYLRKKAKQLEQNIVEYLEANDLPGVKYKDQIILVEQKQKRTRMNKKQQNRAAVEVLESYGISNPSAVLNELMDARKGEEVEETKIKIKSIR